MRPDGRQPNEIRPITIEPDFIRYPEGSVLWRAGDTVVLCNVSLANKTAPFLRGSGEGWVTAEYAMLPGATDTRSDREVKKGKQSGRSQEIQRLIGPQTATCSRPMARPEPRPSPAPGPPWPSLSAGCTSRD